MQRYLLLEEVTDSLLITDTFCNKQNQYLNIN